MRTLRLLLRRAGSQGGFSLPELLIAMLIGLGTTLAVLTILDVSVKQSNAIAGRVNATQRARLAMDQITRQLRSQVCYSTDINALIEAKDDSVTFHADLSDGSRLLEKRELAYDPVTKKITERTWAGVANTGAGLPVLFPAVTRTRTLIDDVVRAPVLERPPNAPIFRYYRYDTAVPPRPSVQLVPPVSAADLKLVAKIDVGFRTLPPASKTTPSSSVTLYNEIYVRVANPNDPVPKPICA